jgi:hypothetical protein
VIPHAQADLQWFRQNGFNLDFFYAMLVDMRRAGRRIEVETKPNASILRHTATAGVSARGAWMFAH